MSARIRLKFPEFGKLLFNFIESLIKGHIVIPVSREYQPGQEIEVEFFLPELEKPMIIKAVVFLSNPERKNIEAEVSNLEEVNIFLAELKEQEKYSELLKNLSIMETGIKVEQIEKKAEGESPEIAIKSVIPPPEQEAEDKPSAKADSLEQVREQKSKPEAIPKEEKPVQELKAPPPIEPKPSATQAKEKKLEPEPVISFPEKTPEAREPVKPKDSFQEAGSDPINQLKQWLWVKKEEKPVSKPQGDEARKQKVMEGKVLDMASLAPLNKFTQSLVKAMLRSGYYSPDHPGAQKAKQGLYQEFREAVKDYAELGFMLQQKVGQAPEFLITGVSEETIPLKKLMGAQTGELFLPKYLDYFGRKRLVSLSFRASIPEEAFYRFVDIMGDPTVDKGEASEAGRLLTRMLVESGITDISAIFEDDLIYIETKLPWRVEMAIQRLAKDLKVLPMFKNVSGEEMRRLKAQIVHDILRPLRTPELLKDIVLNAYIIARQVKEVNEEELEEAIIESFPMNLLLPTSDYIFKEFHRIRELKPENEEQTEIVSHRTRAIKRILKKVAQRVLDEEVEGSEEFLEGLFEQEILSFEELPAKVQEKVNLKKMVNEFQKQSNYWLGKFMEAHTREELELFLQYFSKILPSLLERRDWQNLYLITEHLSRVSQLRTKILKEMEINNPINWVWEKHTQPLVKGVLEEGSETRKGLEQIMHFLGESGIQAVYQELLNEKDQRKRKLLIESLIGFGEKTLDLLRNLLKDPTKPNHLQMLALEALGRAKKESDAELAQHFIKHSKPEIRSEALVALVRIKGEQALPVISALFSDPEPLVVKRLLAVWGGFISKSTEAKTRLLELAFNDEANSEFRAQALQELSRAGWESEAEKEELQARLFNLVASKEGFLGRIKKDLLAQEGEMDKIKISALELLAKFGNEKALEQLSNLRVSGKEIRNKLEDVINQMRLRLKAK